MESMESLAQDNKNAASRRAERKPRGGQAAPGEYPLYNIKKAYRLEMGNVALTLV